MKTHLKEPPPFSTVFHCPVHTDVSSWHCSCKLGSQCTWKSSRRRLLFGPVVPESSRIQQLFGVDPMCCTLPCFDAPRWRAMRHKRRLFRSFYFFIHFDPSHAFFFDVGPQLYISVFILLLFYTFLFISIYYPSISSTFFGCLSGFTRRDINLYNIVQLYILFYTWSPKFLKGPLSQEEVLMRRKLGSVQQQRPSPELYNTEYYTILYFFIHCQCNCIHFCTFLYINVHIGKSNIVHAHGKFRPAWLTQCCSLSAWRDSPLRSKWVKCGGCEQDFDTAVACSRHCCHCTRGAAWGKAQQLFGSLTDLV